MGGTGNLFSGGEDDAQVLQDQRPAGAVGEVDSVEDDGARRRPVGGGAHVRLPGCFALQLCVLHHSLHRGHLQWTREVYSSQVPIVKNCFIDLSERLLPHHKHQG